MLDTTKVKIQSSEEFCPKTKFVPPSTELTFPDKHGWCKNYAIKGFAGLTVDERLHIAHALNIDEPRLNKDELDRALIYALVLSEYTFGAVREFYWRADTRLEGNSVDVEGLYSRALEQVKAVFAQRADMVPRTLLGRAISHMLANQSGELYEQNDVFLMVYYLKMMVEEGFPQLVELLEMKYFPYIEKPEQSRLGLRVPIMLDLCNKFCILRDYKRIPVRHNLHATIRLARAQGFPWFIDWNRRIYHHPWGRSHDGFQFLVLNREWFLAAKLWCGISYSVVEKVKLRKRELETNRRYQQKRRDNFKKMIAIPKNEDNQSNLA